MRHVADERPAARRQALEQEAGPAYGIRRRQVVLLGNLAAVEDNGQAAAGVAALLERAVDGPLVRTCETPHRDLSAASPGARFSNHDRSKAKGAPPPAPRHGRFSA